MIGGVRVHSARRLHGELQHRPVEADVADRELRGVDADRETAGAGIEIVAGERALPARIELALRRRARADAPESPRRARSAASTSGGQSIQRKSCVCIARFPVSHCVEPFSTSPRCAVDRSRGPTLSSLVTMQLPRNFAARRATQRHTSILGRLRMKIIAKLALAAWPALRSARSAAPRRRRSRSRSIGSPVATMRRISTRRRWAGTNKPASTSTSRPAAVRRPRRRRSAPARRSSACPTWRGVLLFRGKGADLVGLMNVYANSPQGLYWLKSSGIKA